MKIITAQNHPDFVAVIGPVADMAQAAAQAKALIEKPENQAVVVLRDAKTLKAGFEAAAANVGRDFMGRVFRLNAEGFTDHYGRPKYDKAGFAGAFGHDFLQQAEFIHAMGGSELQIRAYDASNNQFHSDRSYYGADGQALPFGVTVTMAVKGGGTELIPAGLDAAIEAKIASYNKLHQLWNTHVRKLPEVWGVANGDICINRAINENAALLPSRHRSPRRKRDGLIDERIVGVAFVHGRRLL